MTIETRPLERSDFEHWDLLWQGYLDFYETERPSAYRKAYFERLLADDPHDLAGLVAINGGVPVGLAHYLFHAHGWYDDPICYLQDLYTAPGMRGQGMGQALIEAVYRAADTRGAVSVYWTTQDFNAPARRLYDRVGRKTAFIKYERDPAKTPQ